jgi:hypothetical protein
LIVSGGDDDPFADDQDAKDGSASLDQDPFAEAPTELAVEQFVEELERMMIAGHSQTSLRSWAMRAYSVDLSMLTRFQDMIRKSWTLESQTIGQIRARRDHLRVQYYKVYEQSMNYGQFLSAVKALDSIAKLDGLSAPDVNLTQVNIGEGTYQGQITNGVRERIQKLVETMHLRAEQRANQNARIERTGQVIDVHPGQKKNGTK